MHAIIVGIGWSEIKILQIKKNGACLDEINAREFLASEACCERTNGGIYQAWPFCRTFRLVRYQQVRKLYVPAASEVLSTTAALMPLMNRMMSARRTKRVLVRRPCFIVS